MRNRCHEKLYPMGMDGVREKKTQLDVEWCVFFTAVGDWNDEANEKM